MIYITNYDQYKVIQIKGDRVVIGVNGKVLNRKLYPSDDCKLYYPI